MYHNLYFIFRVTNQFHRFRPRQRKPLWRCVCVHACVCVCVLYWIYVFPADNRSNRGAMKWHIHRQLRKVTCSPPTLAATQSWPRHSPTARPKQKSTFRIQFTGTAPVPPTALFTVTIALPSPYIIFSQLGWHFATIGTNYVPSMYNTRPPSAPCSTGRAFRRRWSSKFATTNHPIDTFCRCRWINHSKRVFDSTMFGLAANGDWESCSGKPGKKSHPPHAPRISVK